MKRSFFYGAGCGSPIKANEVKAAIDAVVPARLPAEVSGDILGATRSLFQEKPGIACIIGTGANSCIYNGKEIIHNFPSLGFILADWGSGIVICRDFLSMLLQEKLSKELSDNFANTYQLDRRQILENIYNKPMANRFLASFTLFLLKYAHDPMCKEIIMNNFRKFFTYFVLDYGLDKIEIKIAATGSVAYRIKSFLLEAAMEMGGVVEQIIQHPIKGPVRYHSLTVPIAH